MEVHKKQTFVIEFLHTKKIAPVDIHRRLINVYGDQRVDVNTVRRLVVRFSSGGSEVRDRLRSGRPRTAVRKRNEELFNQLIRVNRLLRPGNFV
jgi:transposase